MVSITKSTIKSNVWKNFYDRLKDQVNSVTLSISPGTQTIQTYAAGFNDVDFSSESNFPILLINSPRIPQEQLTIGKTQVNGTIDIEIFATNAQAADKFFDAINDAIETYKTTFASLGLKDLDLDSDDGDFVEHGNIKVHIRTAKWKFLYIFDRTRAF